MDSILVPVLVLGLLALLAGGAFAFVGSVIDSVDLFRDAHYYRRAGVSHRDVRAARRWDDVRLVREWREDAPPKAAIERAHRLAVGEVLGKPARRAAL